MSTWKYIPGRIGILDRTTGKFHPKAKVTGVRIHPPTGKTSHEGAAVRGDWYLAEIFTPYGRRTYGFVDACIDSTLKMAVKLGPGQENDEVVAKWKNAPKNACPRPLSGTRRKRRK